MQTTALFHLRCAREKTSRPLVNHDRMKFADNHGRQDMEHEVGITTRGRRHERVGQTVMEGDGVLVQLWSGRVMPTASNAWRTSNHICFEEDVIGPVMARFWRRFDDVKPHLTEGR